MYILVCVYIYIYIYACIHVCVSLSLYIYIYIYTYMRNLLGWLRLGWLKYIDLFTTSLHHINMLTFHMF